LRIPIVKASFHLELLAQNAGNRGSFLGGETKNHFQRHKRLFGCFLSLVLPSILHSLPRFPPSSPPEAMQYPHLPPFSVVRKFISSKERPFASQAPYLCSGYQYLLELSRAREEIAAKMFALVIFHSDNLLRVKKCRTETAKRRARFFKIAKQLPHELQMVLCCRCAHSGRSNIGGDKRETAFKGLVHSLAVDVKERFVVNAKW